MRLKFAMHTSLICHHLTYLCHRCKTTLTMWIEIRSQKGTHMMRFNRPHNILQNVSVKLEHVLDGMLMATFISVEATVRHRYS